MDYFNQERGPVGSTAAGRVERNVLRGPWWKCPFGRQTHQPQRMKTMKVFQPTLVLSGCISIGSTGPLLIPYLD